MSLKRDQSVASNASLLPDIPFKKRKDSRLHAASSHDDDEDNNDHDKKHKKNTRAENTLSHFGEHVSQPYSLSTGSRGTLSTLDHDEDDDDDDDDDNTAYINPYLNHVRSNVIPQEGEGSCNLTLPLVPKGSNHMSVSDVNIAGQNPRAQVGLSSSHEYTPNFPSGLCGITSDFDKYPFVFSQTRNESGNVRSEISGNTFNGEGSDRFISSLMPTANNQLCASALKENSAAHTGLSSASHKLLLNGDLMTKSIVNGISGISGDGNAGMHMKPDPMPSSSLKLCEDLFPLKYDLCSDNVFFLLSPVGTLGSGHLTASGYCNNALVSPFRSHLPSSMNLYENELSPDSKFGVKPKSSSDQAGDLSSSITMREHYRHADSVFNTPWKLSGNQADALPLSLKTCKSEPILMPDCVAHASSSLSLKLAENEPCSSYKCDVDSKKAEQKSGSSSTVKFTERGVSPVFQWKNRRENETPHLPVSEKLDSSEIFRNVERFSGADSSLTSDPDSVNALATKLWKLKRDLPHIIEGTPCSETGTTGEVNTISKQGPPCSCKGSQGNFKLKVGGNLLLVGCQCQGRETNTKEEHCAVGDTELSSRANSCILKDSGIMPVKSKRIQNVADHHCSVIQDVNIDGRKCSADDIAVCIDDTQSLNGEQKKCNSDHEETILVSDDSDDDDDDDDDDDAITIYDINDGFEETDDDIEIVKCLSKSSVGKMDFSVQQKALDFTKSQARYKNHERKYKNMLAHPFEVSNVLNFSKSPVKPTLSSSSNGASNFMDKQRGDEQLLLKKSVLACGGSSDGAMNASRFQPAKLCLDMHHPAPAHTPQVLQCGAYDLSRSTVITGAAVPSTLSPVRRVDELTKGKTFSQFGGSNFPYAGRPLDLVFSPLEYPSSLNLPFPSSSESTSSQWAKKHGCDTNFVPTRRECETSVWNLPVPNSASGDLAASTPESILSIVPNSLEMSVEPADREEHSVPLTGVPQLMPALDTPLETPGASDNVQESKEIMKQQPNIVEDKTETAQRSSRIEWECAICLETISSKRGISATMCGHVYCTPCITEVVCKKKECPTCRRTLESTEVHPLFISG